MPRGALLAWDPDMLPAPLRELRATGAVTGPRVLFPLPDTTLLAGARAVPLEARGGAPPYTWLIDGVPIRAGQRPTSQWRPRGPGFVVATVVDRRGRADRVRFRVSEGRSAGAGQLRGLRVHVDGAGADGGQPATGHRVEPP